MAETKEKAVEKTAVKETAAKETVKKETVKPDAKATVKNVEEKVKAAARKVADKTAKAAEKKQTVKKTAAKAPKTAVILQYSGKEVLYADLIKKATQLSKKAIKKDLKDVKIYVKPEENMAYYVANNGEQIGSFEI